MGREGLVDNWSKNKETKYEKTDKAGWIGRSGAVVALGIRGGKQGLPRTFLSELIV